MNRLFGDRPKAQPVKCYRCGKSIQESFGGGIFTGGGIADAFLNESYACKSCGTVYCLDCMAVLKQGSRICPNCKQDIGW